MRHVIEVQMITGITYKSVPSELDNDMVNLFRNLDGAKYVQIPLSDTQGVILTPKHIVSIMLTEVGE